MNGFIEYAAFAGAIIASVGIALGLEWLSLNGFFRVMPGRLHGRASGEAVRSTDQQESHPK